jgi:hypothetical protein
MVAALPLDPDLVQGALVGLAGAQTGLMLVDEWVYHRRRKLDLFETWGHPIDTALFIAALAVPACLPPSRAALVAFGGLSLLSLLVITKDEWVHARACEPAEHWLHALLFVLHAPVLISVGLTWLAAPDARILRLMPLMVSGWMLFQIAYWTDYHVRRKQRTEPPRPADGSTEGEQLILRRARRPLV